MSDALPFFVYGTLLPGQPNAGMLLPAAQTTQAATFPNGRLHDMGPFPMLVEGGGEAVHGLLVTVHPGKYERVLRRLDALERYDPAAPDDGIYVREARRVRVKQRWVRAWVYLGRSAMAAGRPGIASGSWVEHTASRLDQVQIWWDNFTDLFPGHQPAENLPAQDEPE